MSWWLEKDVLIKGNISGFAHVFRGLFQTIPPSFYVEHCLFHEISHTKCLLPAENTCFSSELLENSFAFWAGYSGICLSRYSPPWWTPAGLCTGKRAGWVSMGIINVPARTMSGAHGTVSHLGWSDFSSKWQLLPSSYVFPPLLIFTGTLYKLFCKVRGHMCFLWENESGGVSCSLENAFVLFFTITCRMPVKQCPPAKITSQRSKSTAVLFSRPPIPHLLLTILSTLLKNLTFSSHLSCRIEYW